MGCHVLLQEVILAQGLTPPRLVHLLHYQQVDSFLRVSTLAGQVVVCSLNRVQLLQPHGQRSLTVCSPRNSPGRNTGVSYHSLLQGIFLSQELNPGLLHCRQILYHVSYKGSLS